MPHPLMKRATSSQSVADKVRSWVSQRWTCTRQSDADIAADRIGSLANQAASPVAGSSSSEDGAKVRDCPSQLTDQPIAAASSTASAVDSATIPPSNSRAACAPSRPNLCEPNTWRRMSCTKRSNTTKSPVKCGQRRTSKPALWAPARDKRASMIGAWRYAAFAICLVRS